jgi:carboxypeptidase PM20D1
MTTLLHKVFTGYWRILPIVVGFCLLVLAVLGFNTLRLAPLSVSPLPGRPLPHLPADSAVRHLQQALRWRTVSAADTALVDTAQFAGLRRLLRRSYPRLHRQLTLQLVGGHTLLYRWPGSDCSLAPVVLLAHQDVVPVDAGSLGEWKVKPFAGVVQDGFIWGRGVTDNKANLVAICEAAESLLATGFRPRQTVYLVFGHDEEVGGLRGAAQAAQLLRARHGRAAWVLEEGGFVTTDRVPGLAGQPVALIGTAEKGYLTVEVSAALPGGHSSLPAPVTALELVSGAVARLRAEPFPAAFTPAMDGFAAHVGPHLPLQERVAFANRQLLEPLILHAYSRTPGGNAAVRTTIVPTVFRSGVQANVVPSTAAVLLNVRLLPGLRSDEALQLLRTKLGDERLHLRAVGFVSEPGPTAPDSARTFRHLESVVHRLVPGVISTPFLMTGITDARHFSDLTPNVYRFSLMTDPQGFHGVNERLSVASFHQSIAFYSYVLATSPASAR